MRHPRAAHDLRAPAYTIRTVEPQRERSGQLPAGPTRLVNISSNNSPAASLCQIRLGAREKSCPVQRAIRAKRPSGSAAARKRSKRRCRAAGGSAPARAHTSAGASSVRQEPPKRRRGGAQRGDAAPGYRHERLIVVVLVARLQDDVQYPVAGVAANPVLDEIIRRKQLRQHGERRGQAAARDGPRTPYHAGPTRPPRLGPRSPNERGGVIVEDTASYRHAAGRSRQPPAPGRRRAPRGPRPAPTAPKLANHPP